MTEYITTYVPATTHVVAPGNSHRASGIPSQDAVHVARIDHGSWKRWTLAVLADGAGSAPEAHAGAWFATRRFIERMSAVVNGDPLGHGPRTPGLVTKRRGGSYKPPPPKPTMEQMIRTEFAILRTEMAELARKNSHVRHDYATTLLFVLNDAVSGETHVLQIGDGAIVIGKPWRMVFAPHRGPSRCFTSFITDADALARVQILRLPSPPDTIVMLSDGLTDITLEEATQTVHAPFFDFLDGLFRSPEVAPLDGDVTGLLSQLIDGPEVRSLTADDMSLVVIARMPKLEPRIPYWMVK